MPPVGENPTASASSLRSPSSSGMRTLGGWGDAENRPRRPRESSPHPLARAPTHSRGRRRKRRPARGSAGALSDAAFCAMKAVLTSARRNAGVRSARASHEAFVAIPSTRTSSTPSMSLSRAASRDGPWAIDLAEQRVVEGRAPGPRSRIRGRRASLRSPSATTGDRAARRWGRTPSQGLPHTGALRWRARCEESPPAAAAGAPPRQTRSCHSTRSSPVIFSVTGCSTCRRVFISMK